MSSLFTENLLLMGILNITPDSFSDGNLFIEPLKAIEQIYKLIEDGADLIDIGAESTRPNALLIDEEEEWKRLKPVLEEINKNKIKIPLSIDTRKAAIAHKCLEMGASIINDVSSLEDAQMENILIKFPNSHIVLTHHRGLPAPKINPEVNLQIDQEIIQFFNQKISQTKIKTNQIILDVGFGFSKGLEENLLILSKLEIIKQYFQLPLLIGLSRKRFIKELWQNKLNSHSLDWASSLLGAVGASKGANIIRSHEVFPLSPLKNI